MTTRSTPPLSAPLDDLFEVTFWGVRGSTPCCGEQFAGFGGNTPCVEIVCGGEQLIFDAGSGLRALGDKLAGKSPNAHMFLTHFHLDHVMGLPFFKPFFEEGSDFKIIAAHHNEDCCITQAVKQLFSPPLMPFCTDMFKADVQFADLQPGESCQVGDEVKISTARLNHPGGANAYRVDYRGRSVSYVTDTEHVEGGLDEEILKLIEGTDVFIYDAMFTDEQYPKFKGFGHSTFREGLKLAEAAGVGTYMPFHHNPMHDDDQLREIETQLKDQHKDVALAREGQTLRLQVQSPSLAVKTA